MKRILALAFFVLMSGLLHATNVTLDLYINRGLMQTVNGSTFPALSFNASPLFSGINATIQLNSGDSLQVMVHNTDTASHAFTVKGLTGSLSIAPADSAEYIGYFPLDGAYVFYDPSAANTNRYMGLAGQIMVLSSATASNYGWNLKDHESAFNQALANGNAVDWNQYEPDFFTVNGLSYPDIDNDPLAHIDEPQGQVYRIYISNTGQSKHSIHLHGFHGRVIHSSASNMQVNSSKDTFPIRSMESVVIEIIPDKVGRYSVHDHNLVAIAAAGLHPNGMFTIMNIH